MKLMKFFILQTILFAGISGITPAFALADDSNETAAEPQPTISLGPGDYIDHLVVDQLKRTAIIHIPPNYDPKKPMGMVFSLHGAAMTGRVMTSFCGLNQTADEKGFIVVYPNGTGVGPLLTWNAGGFRKEIASKADDVSFLSKLIDRVETMCNIDPKRVYACGMSNGGMMCYRLAAELSDRIAAIAPVGGTMPLGDVHPQRSVSVIHFHGTLDTLVPYSMENGKRPYFLRLRSVEESVDAWIKLNQCNEQSKVTDVLSKEGDELKVVRDTFGPGTDGSEVVLVTIEGGGHTWPGQKPPVDLIGKSAMNISANDLMWEFFEKHPMKE